jgi:hypothetical protein
MYLGLNLLTLYGKLDRFSQLTISSFLRNGQAYERVGKFSQNLSEMDSRSQCYKTFYGRNLRVFVIS